MTCQEHATTNQEINLLFIAEQVDYKWLQKTGHLLFLKWVLRCFYKTFLWKDFISRDGFFEPYNFQVRNYQLFKA